MKQTTNHQTIKNWIEKQHGKPAIINHPKAGSDKLGIRVDFPGNQDEQLLGQHETKDISWSEFFDIFDHEHLAFEYEDNPQGSDKTQWYRFVRREDQYAGQSI